MATATTRHLLILAALLLLTPLALHLMGQPWTCTCGTVKLWVNGANGPETSQQLFDWYSLSHVLHGILFWLGLRFLNRRAGWHLSTLTLFTLAMLLECSWELLENSPIIIERYRQTAIANGYVGDSVLNSLSDIACMALGFALADKLKFPTVIALAIAMELLMLWAIRDNLTLNILMLTYPVPAINQWQVGG